jgi:hypothetical protein
MSAEDNEAGTLWDEVLTTELNASNFGILCLTPENLKSRWMHFEAGAISKTVTDYKARVVPLLHDLTPTDVRPPLSRFMSKPLNKEGIYDTLKSINRLLDQRLEDIDLRELFESVWARQLEEQIATIPAGEQVEPRGEEDILTEILELVRANTTANTALSAIRHSSGSTGLPEGVLDGLRSIVGPSGIVSFDGNVIKVKSERFRIMDELGEEDRMFLRNTRPFVKSFGLELRVFGPDGEKLLI